MGAIQIGTISDYRSKTSIRSFIKRKSDFDLDEKAWAQVRFSDIFSTVSDEEETDSSTSEE